MENIQVDEEREAPPEWARAQQTGVLPDKITAKQREYLRALIAERYVKPDQHAVRAQVLGALTVSEDPNEYGMGKAQASSLIDWYKRQPKLENPQAVAEVEGRKSDLLWQQPLADLPQGRYAIENAEGELRFYHRWQGRGDRKDRFALYVMHGQDESKLPRPAQVAIAAKIIEAGVRECAIRYGLEIGSCSNCGRRLTNRISRELGIGPVCGGRMFGDDFSDMVGVKRNEIILRGEDPDEELGDNA